MMIGLTGTPGTGKSTVADELARRGRRVIHLVDTIRPYILEKDEQRSTSVVDEQRWAEEFVPFDGVVEGHLAHYLPCDRIIVLRCRPDILAARLKARGYPEEKIRENVEAEALDVILQETVDRFGEDQIYEIDGTLHMVPEIADQVELVIEGTCLSSYGDIDWSRYLLETP
ncbi:MAG: adenylate kinase family protein [Methanomicrobiales archaeon]|nr:adenylate kinase family protein [Methanomicrobiales archaeon]